MRTSLLVTAITAIAGFSPLVAQTGSFTVYGTGCAGAATGPGCISQNWGTPFQGNAGVTQLFAIAGNSGASAQVVCSLQLYCATRNSNNVVMDVWIYDKAAAGGPGNPIASGKMPVTGTAMANTATFSAPLILTPNTDFFVVLDNSVNLMLPINTTGTKVGTHYFGTAASWRGPFTSSLYWAFNLVCCGASGPIPQISNVGTPTINASFSVDLSMARASSPTMFAIGVTKTGIALAVIGAPGCTLYTDPVLIVGQNSSATGTVSNNFAVPNDPQLVGFSLFGQYAIQDPVNSLGLAFSPGAEIKIGR